MIHLSHGVNIYVATKPVDFRKGHDELATLVQSHLNKELFRGAAYVFRTKRADRQKLIYSDAQLYYKLDLSRNCAAPLTAYYALKENIYGTETYIRI